MSEVILVGGPRDGETRDPREACWDSYLVPEHRPPTYVKAPAGELPLLTPIRVHAYEREWLDGHPTLSFVYRGLW